uniref:Uncharacterized protein n=1 Tax=Anguilla anguilla TaxID=7936 RepID=A0A0E9TSF0_ANGAN
MPAGFRQASRRHVSWPTGKPASLTRSLCGTES